MDPFAEQPTLCLIGSAVDPITKEGYAFDPRSVAQRAESYLKFTGLADTAYFGPEAEFFVFDSVKFHNDPHSAGYAIDSDEGTLEQRPRCQRVCRIKSRLSHSSEGRLCSRAADRFAELICDRRSRSRWANVASLSNAITTKWRPPASAKSISVMPRCWARPTIFKYSNT